MLQTLFPSIPALVSLSLLGLAFGLLLSVAKLKLKVDKDPRIEKVAAALPGANCGACGMPGCSAYATRIVEDKYAIDLCPAGGSDSTRRIADIMGVASSPDRVPLKAKVHCQGGADVTTRRFDYAGPRSCTAAHNTMGGSKTCVYGCLGFGDCVRECKFNAMHMSDTELPVISTEACVGCGQCAKACPRRIISMVPEQFDVHVICMNRDKAKAQVTKKGCSVACIACRLCVKACMQVFADRPDIGTAIDIVDNIAVIDYSKCINCYKCAEVCPVPVIHPLERAAKTRKKREPEEAKAAV